MEINKIYYNKKRGFFYYTISKDNERFYGRTSRILKPKNFMERLFNEEDSKKFYSFTDDIHISVNNIYNPKIDDIEKQDYYELVYIPTEEQKIDFDNMLKSMIYDDKDFY